MKFLILEILTGDRRVFIWFVSNYIIIGRKGVKNEERNDRNAKKGFTDEDGDCQ